MQKTIPGEVIGHNYVLQEVINVLAIVGPGQEPSDWVGLRCLDRFRVGIQEDSEPGFSDGGA